MNASVHDQKEQVTDVIDVTPLITQIGDFTIQALSLLQGMVDGSASKPALRQDTGYMVEKT